MSFKAYTPEDDPVIWNILTDQLVITTERVRTGLFAAAIVHQFDAACLAMICDVDQAAGQNLLETIITYPFVIAEANGRYRLHEIERSLLNWAMIQYPDAYQTDRLPSYRIGQQRALDYWRQQQGNSGRDREQEVVYHNLFIHPDRGERELRRLYQTYEQEQLKAAQERLLHIMLEARHYIDQSRGKADDAEQLIAPDLRKAQLYQALGRWDESFALLERLEADDPTWAQRDPTMLRTKAIAVANRDTPDNALAITLFHQAIEAYKVSVLDPEQQAVEIARTRLALGDAQLGLVRRAQPYQLQLHVVPQRPNLLSGLLQIMIALPLTLYLIWTLGRKVLNLNFLQQVGSLDWVLGYYSAQAAQNYQVADEVLEQYLPEEWLGAETRLARLFLQMGNYVEARKLFDMLAEHHAQFSEYEQALLQLGHGEAYVRLGALADAERVLNSAEERLRHYFDTERLAEVNLLLAEVEMQRGRHVQGVDRYERTLHMSTRAETTASVTLFLQELAEEPLLSLALRERVAAISAETPAQSFPTRYRHRVNVQLRQAIVACFFLVGFTIVTWAIRLSPVQAGIPAIQFAPVQLLNVDQAFASEIGQDVTQFTVSVLDQPDVLISHIVLLLLLYIVVVTLIGFISIRLTSPETLQMQESAETFTFDGKTLQKGTNRAIQLDRVTDVIIADVRLTQHHLPDRSETVLLTVNERITIPGYTVHYQLLKQQIIRQLPNTAQVHDISTSFAHSKMGLLFGNTVLFIVAIAILTKWFTLIGTLAEAFTLYVTRTLVGDYTLVDVYIYLYLGIFLPPFWWFFVQPLRKQIYMRQSGAFGYLAAGAGLLFTFLLWGLQMRFPMTQPDIYPPLAILILVGMGSWHIVTRSFYAHQSTVRRRIGRKRRRFGWVRGSTGRIISAIVASQLLLMTTLFMVSYITREVIRAHHIVRGNGYRNQAELADPSLTAHWLQQAVDRYSDAITMVELPVLRAQSAELDADLYANRGAVYLSLTSSESDLSAPEIEAMYRLAIADLDQAIRLDRSQSQYHLWNGFAHHALGEQQRALELYEAVIALESNALESSEAKPTDQKIRALVGKGWIHYQAKEVDEAMLAFAAAVDDVRKLRSPKGHVDAYVGLGYATYAKAQQMEDDTEALLLYEDASAAWQTSAQIAPDSLVAHFNMGIVDWRLASRDSGMDCAYYDQSLSHLAAALNVTDQTQLEKGFTHRTAGQVQWLRGNKACDGTDAYVAALAHYDQAIALDPQNAHYMQMRGRISYSHWLSFPGGTGPSARSELINGLRAVDQALTINASDGSFRGVNDYRPNWARNVLLYPNAIEGSIDRGYEMLQSAAYASAFAYLEPVARYLEEDSELAFAVALAAYGNGDEMAARDWYARGIERADGDAVYLMTAYLDLFDRRDVDSVLAAELLVSFDIDALEASPTLINTLQTHVADMLAQQAFANAINAFERLTQYQPPTHDDLFEIALAAYQAEAQTQAVALYRQAIEQAQAAEDDDAIVLAWNRLHQLGDERPSNIETLFTQTEVVLTLLAAPSAYFADALERVATGDEAGAVEQFSQGIQATLLADDLEPLTQAVLSLRQLPASEPQARALQLVRDRFGELERLARSTQAITKAAQLGYIGLAVGDDAKSAEWYNHAIYRIHLDPNKFGVLRSHVRQLEGLWLTVEETGSGMVQELEKANGLILEAHPDLLENAGENGRYWRRRAWIFYDMAGTAFRAGDVETARLTLAEGQASADLSAEFEGIVGDDVSHYLLEGALPWFYIAAGNKLVDANQYADALEMYTTARGLYSADLTNQIAKEEQADVLFKVGLMQFAVGAIEQAESDYQSAIKILPNIGLTQVEQRDIRTHACDGLTSFAPLSVADEADRTRLLTIICPSLP